MSNKWILYTERGDIINCRVLKKGKCEITQNFSSNHPAIDLVGENSTLDEVIAHSDGIIVNSQDGYNNLVGSRGNESYGNFIKIDHGNGYYTLYAHMSKGLSKRNGTKVKKGEVIGLMSDSGNAYGKHLHFEVINGNQKVDPIKYLDSDFSKSTVTTKYKIGDYVKINAVYISSTSSEKLTPSITEGKITRIIPSARNPYLLDNGNIGWINDSCIVNDSNKYLSNSKYKGFSIVDALKEINVDSSYEYRSKLAKLNGINNYTGTGIQNTNMLNLLKNGKLRI